MNIETVRELLGIPADPKIDVEIDTDGTEFGESQCWVGEPHPACVHVDWWAIDYDRDTDAPRWGGLEQQAFCWEHAIEVLAEIVEESAPFEWGSDCKPFGADIDDPMVKVVVNASFLASLQVPA